ncbi:hypothetical protein HELRODRAFT_185503 [Helobdella robusta]|uniref:Aquaporin n=1 Tax=Helobdella robusta TaxID=6412 RepID=T1FMW6_HELRO|nr:hypothetical protein HELRODRAFT_185503 [Helobdella robusta]ESO05156.1 hypothetical protein HELRODRAFT_185503 [Helobdella robusta]
MSNFVNKAITTNLNDLKSSHLYRSLVCEFIGTFILIFMGCFSIITWNRSEPPSLVAIALCFGIIIAILATAFGGISGCHINPAVSLGFLVTRRISLIRFLLYAIVQAAAAIAGAKLLYELTPEGPRRELQVVVMPLPGISDSNAAFVEFFLTFLLMFTVYACIDGGKPVAHGTAPFIIGLSVTTGVFSAGLYSGGCMNPIRALGPAVVQNYWRHHWVYWVGPMMGAVVAALLYDLLFDTAASLRKLKLFFTSLDYDANSFYVKPREKIDASDLEKLRS